MPVSKAEKHSKAETGKQSPEFGFAEFFSFCTRLLVKQELPDAKTKLCAATQSKLSKNSAQAEFLCFCVFAGKNAVYLANQSCKDGESKALCHKARHRGSRGALAHKNSLLTKRREPKPTNSALASKKPYLTKSP